MTGEKARISTAQKTADKTSYAKLKRFLDVFISYLLLCISYIPMLAIALSIKLTTSGSVIFRQIRIGADGKRFICYKFRTMSLDAPSELPTSEFSDSALYVTPIGRFLRKTSLDELPQLFNVLAGDMSLVGPRPLIECEQNMHKRRAELGVYSLRPGITGLAQVNGRDMIDDEVKLSYDAEYSKDLCLLSDLKIIIRTVIKVFTADGVEN